MLECYAVYLELTDDPPHQASISMTWWSHLYRLVTNWSHLQ